MDSDANGVSFSPRQPVAYVEDKTTYKDVQKIMTKGDVAEFMGLLYNEVLRVKPNDILDFICDDFLGEDGAAKKQLSKK